MRVAHPDRPASNHRSRRYPHAATGNPAPRCTFAGQFGRWGMLAAISVGAATGVSTYAAYKRDITAARQRVAAGGRLIDTAVGPIQYAEVGYGAPVLMIHGAGGGYDQGHWGFRDGLGEQAYRVIAPSRFGYLGTPLPADGSPAAQADAHAALLDALEVDRVAVVAASAGVLSAMQFAIRYPDRVSALVLLVPDSWAPPSEHPTEELMANPFVMNVVLKSDFVMWAFMKLAPASSGIDEYGLPECGLPKERKRHRRCAPPLP